MYNMYNTILMKLKCVGLALLARLDRDGLNKVLMNSVRAGWVHDVKLYQFKTEKFVVMAKGQAVISIKHRKNYSYFYLLSDCIVVKYSQ